MDDETRQAIRQLRERITSVNESLDRSNQYSTADSRDAGRDRIMGSSQSADGDARQVQKGELQPTLTDLMQLMQQLLADMTAIKTKLLS